MRNDAESIRVAKSTYNEGVAVSIAPDTKEGNTHLNYNIFWCVHLIKISRELFVRRSK